MKCERVPGGPLPRLPSRASGPRRTQPESTDLALRLLVSLAELLADDLPLFGAVRNLSSEVVGYALFSHFALPAPNTLLLLAACRVKAEPAVGAAPQSLAQVIAGP